MISITCDRCDRPLEVPDDKAGERYTCPHCGDVNKVPELQSAGPVDRATKAGLPPDAGPEQTVMRLRPAMFRARPMLFMVLALVVILGLVAAFWWGLIAKSPSTLQQVLVWVGLIGALGSLGTLGVWKLKTMSASLEITNKRTIERRGLLSRASSEVLHDSIRNFQVDQTFWNRVWGVGSIGISSSGQDGIEIHVRDLPSPGKIQKVIDLYRPLG